MITYKKLQKIADTRLKDSRVLYNGRQFNGAVYICGYANECALKAVICKKLNLRGIPNIKEEFENIPKNIGEIHTHDLEKLLTLLVNLKGEKIRDEIYRDYSSDWNIILDWNPEKRYLPIDEKSKKEWEQEADKLIRSTAKMLRYFWKKL